MGPPGHMAIGLAAKSAAPKVPLWLLLLTSELLDFLAFGLTAVGIETMLYKQVDLRTGITYFNIDYQPWSHGLLMSVVWSVLAAGIVYLVYRDRRSGVVVGLVVFSHWILDFFVHGPDLPLLFEGSPKVGLGLWTSGPGLIISGILEIALLAGGSAIYIASRKKKAGDLTAA